MSELKLINISKTYQAGTQRVEALKNISIEFRKSEFVSILGPSGCGKTTLLNLIGGLDRYDSGDLIINNVSTKKFKDADWDAYRNRSIGFVFQNYNLITHQSVLANVEIAMTLSGVKAAERKKRAKEALMAVNLEDQLKKKPNQLSGGQMQRVAIARALVNNPDIILADEPTGSLDSHTSLQIMEILREISKTRLVIMVTHNQEVAEEYSSRIIHLLDGEIQNDNHIIHKKEEDRIPGKEEKFKKTSMSLSTATGLSFKNLLTKKGRTIITSLAGSIGIIGVALVLSLSNGLSHYISVMQADMLSGFPITITTGEQRIDFAERRPFGNEEKEIGFTKFSAEETLYRYDKKANTTQHINVFTDEYLMLVAGLNEVLPDAVNTIAYSRGVTINLLAKGEETVVRASLGRSQWQEMPENKEFILSLYDLIGEESRMPENMNEIMMVVDEYNRVDEELFQKLGIFTQQETYQVADFIGRSILKVIPNNEFYVKNEEGVFIPATSTKYSDLYASEKGVMLTITGILRLKENAASSYLTPGIVYTTMLTDYIIKEARLSDVAIAQEKASYDVVLNIPFANESAKKLTMIRLGADTTPTAINIYPKDFNSKEEIKNYLEDYNMDRETDEQVIFTDLAESITSVIGRLLNTITYVLIGFAAISLLVSTIMIGIITYVSVIERTKEIGILRSVGARKKDISRVFNAETLIVGFIAGVTGVGLSYLLIIPINIAILKLTDIENLASLTIIAAVLLIVGSMILTSIAGLIPSRMAAKKDPVEALRTE